jgi:hypothetical protein
MTKVLGAAQRRTTCGAALQSARQHRSQCQKPARDWPGELDFARENDHQAARKRNPFMNGRDDARHAYLALDAQSGGDLPFSPASKTWATKTTTKTV